MRRAVPSFTVEVRRRPRLPVASNPGAQPSQSNPPLVAFDRASDGAAAAAFGAKKMDGSLVDVAASHSGGRILPSLIPDEPQNHRLEYGPLSATDSESPSRAPTRPAVRARKQGDQVSKSPSNSNFLSDENAPLPEVLDLVSSNVQVRLDQGVVVGQGNRRGQTRRVRQVKLSEIHAS